MGPWGSGEVGPFVVRSLAVVNAVTTVRDSFNYLMTHSPLDASILV